MSSFSVSENHWPPAPENCPKKWSADGKWMAVTAPERNWKLNDNCILFILSV
jgi:hypothetical protein